VLGVSDSAPALGAVVALGSTLAVSAIALVMFTRGYRLKA